MIYYYDAKGDLYGYTEDNITLYTFNGMPSAYIDNEYIYTYDGKCVGFYDEGQVWDSRGCVLLFTKDARFGVGPLKPAKSLMPLKHTKSKIPLKKRKKVMSPHILKHRKWSSLTPELAFA